MIGPQLPERLKRPRDDGYSASSSQQPPLKRVRFNVEETKAEKINDDSNQKMHPRNIYRWKRPDFYKLSKQYPFFATVVKHNTKTDDYYIDYSDDVSNVLLTKVLLKHDFDLEFEHPINHLCPPITQRLNYLLWIQDLLQCVHDVPDTTETNQPSQRQCFHGFDIGVGASCIFPLLGIKIGAQQDQNWSFIASDIDIKSVEYANKNVQLNKLGDKIQIVHQPHPRQIFQGVIMDSDADKSGVDFTVCNPPFFDDLQDTSLNKKRANNATSSELVYDDGGEVGFVAVMIREIDELQLYKKVKWFTTMLGKKSSVKRIKLMLQKSNEASHPFIVTTEFVQGKQVRYGMAWTFDERIKHCYHVLYDANNTDSQHSLKSNDRQSNRCEFLFDMSVNANTADYQSALMKKLQRMFMKYGIECNPVLTSLYNQREHDNKHGWIQIDHLQENGFTFGLKCILTPKPSNDAQVVVLAVMITIRFHEGDEKLFSGFAKWLQQNLTSPP